MQRNDLSYDWIDSSRYLDYHYPYAFLCNRREIQRARWICTRWNLTNMIAPIEEEESTMCYPRKYCVPCLDTYTACTLRMPDLRVSKAFSVLVFIRRLDRISSTDRIEALAKWALRIRVNEYIIYSSSIKNKFSRSINKKRGFYNTDKSFIKFTCFNLIDETVDTIE